MSSDPYSVLGVSRDASDEEIKTAYRRLAKRYHPDLHPGDEEAARRMNEINAAYDQIKNPQPDPGPAGGYGYGGYAYGGDYDRASRNREETERNELRAARNYIRSRHFQEAVTALSGVPYGERDAEWYYLHAIASFNLGNRVSALNSARRACNLAPGDPTYRNLLDHIESGGQTYAQTGSSYGYRTMNAGGSWFVRLCLVNLILNLFCGRGFCCC